MGLQTGQEHALGREREIFIGYETTALDYLKPVAADVVRVLTSKIGFSQGREKRQDAELTRSHKERISRNKMTMVELEMYAALTGSFATESNAPSFHQPLYSLMGGYSVDADSHDYTLANSQVKRTLSVTHKFNSVLAEAARGWVPTTGKFSLAQGEEPKFNFTGPAKRHISTVPCVLDEVLSGGETDFDVTAGTADALEVGSMIQVGSSTGAAGVGHMVTAISGVNVTVDVAIDGAQSQGDAIVPFLPSASKSDTVIAGIDGSFQIDSADVVPITAVEWTHEENIKEHRYIFDAEPGDFTPELKRDVTGVITAEMRRDVALYLNGRKKFNTYQLDVNAGLLASAGGPGLISVNFIGVEMDFSDVEIPAGEMGTVTFPFVALGSSGEDEYSLSIT